MDSLPFAAEADDGVWRALAHPVRRRLLDALRDGPLGTGDLVAAVGGERHAVMQHLSVLREAELVTVRPDGRRRLNFLNPVPIQLIYERWVAKYERNWTAALVGLKRAAEGAAGMEGTDRTASRPGPGERDIA
jgi:DNA-binding transcriptional ArsR family regulator